MNVTYDYYRVFYYVGKYGNFTKAAKALKTTQPNVTRMMNNLEAQLEIKLLNRNKSGATLTAEGEIIYEKISAAFEQINLAEHEIEGIRNREKDSCSIGLSDIGMYEIFLPSAPYIRERFANTPIRLTNVNMTSAIQDLKDGLLDMAIVTTPIPPSKNYEIIPLKTISECAVCAKTFPGIEDRVYELKELLDYPMVMMNPQSSTRAFYDSLFAQQGLVMNPVLSTNMVSQVVSIIDLGLGIGFIPESILSFSHNIRKVELNEKIPSREICLLFNPDRPMVKSVRMIMEYIIKNSKKTKK